MRLNAGARRDPPPPALVDHFRRIAAFVGRHRVDDAKQPLHILLGIHIVERVFEGPHAGNQPHHFLKRTEAFDLAQLRFEIVERKFALAHPLFLAEHFVLIEFTLCLFDKRENIPLPQDASRHAVGVEFFERIKMLARADEFDRHTGDLLYREGRPASGIAIHFGEDHAIEFQGFVEDLGAVHRVLARHTIDNQVNLMRRALAVDAFQLLHQLIIDVQSACRIENDDIGTQFLGLLDRRLANDDRIFLRAIRKNGNPQLLAQYMKLVDRRGTLQVGSHQQRLTIRFLEHASQLAAGCCFP